MKTEYNTIRDIQQKNKDEGRHFFSPDTMRFFSSRVISGVYGGMYFVTSEKHSDDTPRQYTVHRARFDGSIQAVTGQDGESDAKFDTLNDAKAYAKERAESADNEAITAADIGAAIIEKEIKINYIHREIKDLHEMLTD